MMGLYELLEEGKQGGEDRGGGCNGEDGMPRGAFEARYDKADAGEAKTVKAVNGRGVWQLAGVDKTTNGAQDVHLYYLYYDGGGAWYVSRRKAHMEAGMAEGVMKVVSTALTPDQITETWQVLVDSTSFEDAPKVTAGPLPPAPWPLTPKYSRLHLDAERHKGAIAADHAALKLQEAQPGQKTPRRISMGPSMGAGSPRKRRPSMTDIAQVMTT
jgi:hypothetical protein